MTDCNLTTKINNLVSRIFKSNLLINRKVLKEISISDMEADESIESVQEAQLLSKLDNPYILKYHESFLDGDFFCIVTEYCEVIIEYFSARFKYLFFNLMT